MKPVRIRWYPLFAFSLGAFILFLLQACPIYFFALTWIFPFLIIDAVNYSLGYDSFMKFFEKGLTYRLISTLIAGFVWHTLGDVEFLISLKMDLFSALLQGNKVFEMSYLAILASSFSGSRRSSWSIF